MKCAILFFFMYFGFAVNANGQKSKKQVVFSYGIGLMESPNYSSHNVKIQADLLLKDRWSFGAQLNGLLTNNRGFDFGQNRIQIGETESFESQVALASFGPIVTVELIVHDHVDVSVFVSTLASFGYSRRISISAEEIDRTIFEDFSDLFPGKVDFSSTNTMFTSSSHKQRLTDMIFEIGTNFSKIFNSKRILLSPTLQVLHSGRYNAFIAFGIAF